MKAPPAVGCYEAKTCASKGSPREALDTILREALRGGPCYVAFSGGRDSSALLAAATVLARREGYDDPIAVTEQYSAHPETDETEWQEKVICHIGLDDWVRIRVGDESDLLGSKATSGLERRGLIWPATLHVKDNILSALAGGCLITGEGGDEMFGARRSTPWLHLRKGVGVRRQIAALQCAETLLPARRRRALILDRLRQADFHPWLRPEAKETHMRGVAADLSEEPIAWSRSTIWHARARGAAILSGNYSLVASEAGVTLVEPFRDPRFVAALARAGGIFGYPDRTTATRELFGDVLPGEVIERKSKAWFNRVYFGEYTRRFAESWDGAGVDGDLVHIDHLRSEWLSEVPSAMSALLLHAAWLASR